jgi:hypothetical protein
VGGGERTHGLTPARDLVPAQHSNDREAALHRGVKRFKCAMKGRRSGGPGGSATLGSHSRRTKLCTAGSLVTHTAAAPAGPTLHTAGVTALHWLA